MSRLPPRSDPKAIFFPSGDHAGSESRPGLWVRFRAPVPSAAARKISMSPVWFEAKRSFGPSAARIGGGDQEQTRRATAPASSRERNRSDTGASPAEESEVVYLFFAAGEESPAVPLQSPQEGCQ